MHLWQIEFKLYLEFKYVVTKPQMYFFTCSYKLWLFQPVLKYIGSVLKRRTSHFYPYLLFLILTLVMF